MPDTGTEYIRYLQKAGCDPEVIAHSRVVHDVAIQIADRIIKAGKIPVNRNLVAAGSILHDIGRSQTHGMDHADVGGKICRDFGLSPRICLIVERHIGAGLSGSERASFGLPYEDRVPDTIEEKIVAHADNLVKGIKVISRADLDRANGKFPDMVRARFSSLANELESLAGSDLP
ncbi:MAG: phosphohydrolase [Methanomicrobiales archaeon HGW-Methanomicrobiales-4]|nr:MAG: phosphohydrolase [Methanomicrobiales archaeon HGW-Methanomicrobiales-4]